MINVKNTLNIFIEIPLEDGKEKEKIREKKEGKEEKGKIMSGRKRENSNKVR